MEQNVAATMVDAKLMSILCAFLTPNPIPSRDVVCSSATITIHLSAMEEAKLQALHDTLSKLGRGRQGLGTRSQYSWQKQAPRANDNASSLPSNPLQAYFHPEGQYQRAAVDDGDGRAIKRDFSDDESESSSKKKLSKAERKAAKKAAKLEAKRMAKLEEKKRAKKESKRLKREQEEAAKRDLENESKKEKECKKKRRKETAVDADQQTSKKRKRVESEEKALKDPTVQTAADAKPSKKEKKAKKKKSEEKEQPAGESSAPKSKAKKDKKEKKKKA